MKKRHNPFLTVLVTLLCLALIVGAVYLLMQVIPAKRPAAVSKLETSAVFEEPPAAVEPEREAAYEGELPAVLPEQSQPEPEPQPEAETPPVSDPADDPTEKAQLVLAAMTEEEKLWQLFFVTPEALTGYDAVTQAGEATKAAIEEKPVGGLIYFTPNLLDAAQTQQMLQNTQSYSKIPLFLATDEEGGTVQRIGSNPALGGQAVEPMRTYGQQADPAAVYDAGAVLAENLTNLGFNLDFAPSADVAASAASVIGSRSFGSDPELVSALSGVLARSLTDHGVIPCMKHFPGYGSAVTDDHSGRSVSKRTLEELESCDLLPFADAVGEATDIPFIMVSHLSFPEITGDDTPADLSPLIVSELLRNKLEYQNVIITDAQNMGAVTDTCDAAEAAVRALEAGCDMLLCPADLQSAYDGIAAALESGRLDWQRIEQSLLRILTVKARYGLF